MQLVFLNGLPIKIKKGESGFWKDDLVSIRDPLKASVSEKEIKVIMDYLYQEGFIQDRRTPHEVIKKSE